MIYLILAFTLLFILNKTYRGLLYNLVYLVFVVGSSSFVWLVLALLIGRN
jgi:hypothetical protein